MKEFIISFTTISGRVLEKTVKAVNSDEACDKLDKKYNIAYFNECTEKTNDTNEIEFYLGSDGIWHYDSKTSNSNEEVKPNETK